MLLHIDTKNLRSSPEEEAKKQPVSSPRLIRQENSAVRIAEYLQAYSLSPRPESQTDRPVSSFQPRHAQGSKPGNPQSKRIRINANPDNQYSQLISKASEVAKQINSLKSDQLELQRDLALYEHLLCTEIQAQDRFDLIRNLSEVVANCSTCGQVGDLLASVQSCLTVNKEASPATSRSIDRMDFTLRQETRRNLHSCIYKGCVYVSGIYCLLKVYSTEFKQTARCEVLTVTGEHLHLMLPIKSETWAGKDSRMFTHAKIAPALHFVLEHAQLKLQYDESHGKDFLSLILSLKGHPQGLVGIKVTADDSYLHLTIPGTGANLTIRKDWVTRSGSIFQTQSRILINQFSQYLFYHSQTQTLSLLPNPQNAPNFQQKESKSLFANSQYIESFFHALTYHLVASDVLHVKSQYVKVNILQSKIDFKVTASIGENTFELVSGNQMYQFLVNLQGLSGDSKFTVFRSLELRSWLLSVVNVHLSN